MKAPAGRVILGDGRSLAFAEYGDPAGRTIMYFHGWPSSRLEAAVLHPEALRHRLRIIAPDRPGFGLSEFKPGRKLVDWPDDVVELADALGLERFGVLGWSGGGPYVAVCAWSIPHRLDAAGIVAGQGPPDVPGGRKGMRRQNRVLLQLGRRAPALVGAPLWWAARALERDPVRFLAGMAEGLPPADRALLAETEHRERSRTTALEAFRGGLRGAILENALYATPWGFELGDITAELLLWHGEQDANTPPAAARYIAANVPRCRAIFLRDEGHVSVMIHHMDGILETLGGPAGSRG